MVNKNSQSKTEKKTSASVATAPHLATAHSSEAAKKIEKKPEKPTVHNAQKAAKKHWIVAIVAAVLLLMTGVGAIVAINHHDANQEVEEEAVAVVEEEDPGEGEEQPAEEESNGSAEEEAPVVNNGGGGGGYQVAWNRPKYLSIPSLGLYNVAILSLGLLADGSMDTPANPALVGWYTGSALPGERGVSYMGGHGGDLGIGIFKNLPRIAKGADVIIEMGDGRRFTYTIVDVAWRHIGEEANNYMTTAFTSPVPGAAALTLQTCTGEWIRASQTYTHRFFARAVLK